MSCPRWPRWPISTVCLLTGLVRLAEAQSVVVVRPPLSDRLLVEVSSRLCGELHMYGLKCALVDTDDRLATAAGTDNSNGENGSPEIIGRVTFLRTPEQAIASIWVVEKALPKESARIAVSVGSSDAPGLLAMRAADVLRASLLDGNRTNDAQSERTFSTSAAALAPESSGNSRNAMPRGFDRWSVAAGAAMLYETRALGSGIAPTIQIARRFHPRLALALSFTGPARGQEYVSSLATARVGLEFGTLSVAFRLVGDRQLSLDIVQGIGGAHFSVRGAVEPPWIGQNASAWAVASSTGTSVALALSNHLAFTAGIAALFVLPQPVLEVTEDAYRVHQPLLLANAGFSYGFY